MAWPATISFPADYDGSGDNPLFVGINTGTGGGDVYKINLSEASAFSRVTDLNVGQKYGLNDVDIRAFTAAGDGPAILIAGEANSTRTYASTDGGSNWTRSRKEPSGEAVTFFMVSPDFATTGYTPPPAAPIAPFQ